MDTMTYLVHKVTELPKNKIIGMGETLDSARFKFRLAEAMDCPISDIDGLVVGEHSDASMIPLTRLATRNSLRVSNFLDDQKLQKIMEDTKVGEQL